MLSEMSDVIIISILIILIIVGISLTVKNFKGEGGCCGGGSSVKVKRKKLKQVVKERTVIIEGMTCEHCKARVESRLNSLDGVSAKVNLKSQVLQGDVSALTLEENSYDLATAFETIYFWPGLTKCFTEVAKILKPGGIFMIVNESDGTDATSLKFEKIIEGMKNHTAGEIEAALKTAGFSKVKSMHHPKKPWITVIGRK